MKRQKVKSTNYNMFYDNGNKDDINYFDQNIPMEQSSRTKSLTKPTLDAQIQEGDTLQAIALRYDCTVADLKRLNKIEKEIEIHARRTLKVPAKAHLLLFDTQPIVHKSGQNSPNRTGTQRRDDGIDDNNKILSTHSNQLNEKLLVAAVSLSGNKEDSIMSTPQQPSTSRSVITPGINHQNQQSINDIILNSELISNNYRDSVEDDHQESIGKLQLNYNDISSANEGIDSPLIDNTVNGNVSDDNFSPRPIPILKNEFTCNGSDCDISWICLLIFILALCFAIPLIYIFYIAEHPEKYHH